jgi:hypothetical protein
MAGEASLLGLPIELKGAVLEYVSDLNVGHPCNNRKLIDA